jgi:hypothetical protein
MAKTTTKPRRKFVVWRRSIVRPARKKRATWTFLRLPTAASAKLPFARYGVRLAEPSTNCVQATLEPDGQGGHWLKVEKKLREAAGANAVESVALETRATHAGSGTGAQSTR